MLAEPQRLEGWKQIASFLNKDLRTVQRWERLEGLPIHRHLHRAQASVYAFPEELEAWLRQRSSVAPLPTVDASPDNTAPGRRRFVIWHYLVAATAVILLAGGVYLYRARAIPASPEEIATTSSPNAAALFAQARAASGRTATEQASVQEKFLREALREDPRFASAWHALFWALKRQNQPKSEWMPLLEKAHGLAPSVSVEERLRIDADYYMMRRDYTQAIAARRAYLQLAPASPDALRRLLLAYEWTGRYEDAIPLALDYVHLRPNDRLANYVAALSQAIWSANPAQGRSFALRASQLAASDPTGASPAYPWADTFPLYELWANNQLPQLRAELDHLAQNDPPYRLNRRDNYLRVLGLYYLALQQPAPARALFDKLSPERRPAAYALLAFLQNQPIPPYNGTHTYPDSGITAVILARAGQLDAARAARQNLESIQAPDGDLMAVDAELLAAQNQTPAAIELFRSALDRLRLSGSPLYFLAAERLAQILDQQHRRPEALATLRAALTHRTRAFTEMGPGGAFILRAQTLLSQLESK